MENGFFSNKRSKKYQVRVCGTFEAIKQKSQTHIGDCPIKFVLYSSVIFIRIQYKYSLIFVGPLRMRPANWYFELFFMLCIFLVCCAYMFFCLALNWTLQRIIINIAQQVDERKTTKWRSMAFFTHRDWIFPALYSIFWRIMNMLMSVEAYV